MNCRIGCTFPLKKASHLLVVVTVVIAMCSAVSANSLRMATTTSTENTGLLNVLNPPFESEYGVRVDVIAVGTGKALKLAENGDVDLLLVHAPEAERQFIQAGYGVHRRAVMHNDFIVLGPESDPAKLKQSTLVSQAFKSLAESQSDFISRGDDSGTHKKEKLLWQAANIIPSGTWYISVGQGMGAVLRIANDKRAYTLSDRGTFLAFRDKISLIPVFEGSIELFNPYHVIAVNPEVHSHVRHSLAKLYINYLTGEKGQAIIVGFKKHGLQLFHADAIAHLN